MRDDYLQMHFMKTKEDFISGAIHLTYLIVKTALVMGKGVEAYAIDVIVIRFLFGCELCFSIYNYFFGAKKCKFNLGLVNGFIFYSSSWVFALFNIRKKTK